MTPRDLFHDLRYKLQRRVSRLNAASASQLPFALVRFFKFLDSVPAFASVIDELHTKFPNIHGEVNLVFQGQEQHGETEAESAAIGEGVLRRLASMHQDPHALIKIAPIGPGGFADAADFARAMYLTPFYDYLDERLDDQGFIVSKLVGYKKRCEWFRREFLYDLWKNDSRRGERRLAFDLYEYLFDEGVDIHMEPTSASGEADMVSLQRPEEPFIGEAKIFSGDKTYIARAFRQIYQYTCDYNEPSGYLIIFNVCEKMLSLSLSLPANPLARVEFNKKSIFLIPIDIYPHPPASKRPIAETVTITEAELTRAESIVNGSSASAI